LLAENYEALFAACLRYARTTLGFWAHSFANHALHHAKRFCAERVLLLKVSNLLFLAAFL
jgi:hypothetical protein